MPLESPDVWAMADLATPFAVRTAATLRVPDVVKDGPLPLAEIAHLCKAEADPLGRVLRFLVHHGMFTEPEPDVFGPNEASDALRSDLADGPQPWLDLDGAVGRADLAFVELIEQVRGHHPAYPAAFGRSFWEDLAHNPQLSDSFDSLMETKTYGIAPLIATAHDWSAYARIADVGGGKGVLLAEILRTSPQSRGILVDLIGPARNAADYLQEQGVAERAEVVTESFFDPLPVQADAAVICDVLGDWDDEDAIRILEHCRQAVEPDGRVLIIELLPDKDRIALFTEMDLRMMIYVGGRLRDLDRTQQVAAAAGLTVEDFTPLDNGYAIIECRPER
ncbi:methyltransferase [Saccharopolyspora spinosa]|uniref:O-methyltransferase n=1 Tax=Saccharopolyspora spinosa TaxID=60894 RepID=A0A2N3XW66_SACSN|nr:methyltransferase [Saccharopolyspora spinosa]PKW14905.1 O-methyltransferase [Saccharopolyspora spinosa]